MMQAISPLDPRILRHGRTLERRPLPLFWAASGVELETCARSLTFVLRADFSTREPWVRVEVDGATVLRQPLERGRNRVTVWRDMPAGSWHRVQLFKETQPMARDPRSLLALETILCEGTLRAVPPRPYKIEVIGDSISSGEGLAGGSGLHGALSMVFSTQGLYAVRTARDLNADLRILSQNGWGLCTGWDNDRTKAMPLYYDAVCGLLPDAGTEALGAREPQDFSSWQPDIVVVHLGNNDASALRSAPWMDGFALRAGPDGLPDAPSAACFTAAGTAFLQHLHQCVPRARLVWCYGTSTRVMEPCIREAIRQYGQLTGDTALYVPLPVVLPSQRAADDHPGPAAHAAMARTLTEALQPLLPPVPGEVT